MLWVCPDIDVGTVCHSSGISAASTIEAAAAAAEGEQAESHTETHPVWPNHGHRQSRRPGPSGQGSHRVFDERSGWRFSARQCSVVYGSVESRSNASPFPSLYRWPLRQLPLGGFASAWCFLLRAPWSGRRDAGSYRRRLTMSTSDAMPDPCATEAPAPAPALPSPQPDAAQSASGPKGKGKGRRREDESPDVKISKALSYILRHGAAKEGLKMRPDGYVRVDDIVRLLRRLPPGSSTTST